VVNIFLALDQEVEEHATLKVFSSVVHQG